MHVRADPKLGSSCEHPSLPVVLDERKRTAPIQKCSPLSLASTTLPQDAKPADESRDGMRAVLSTLSTAARTSPRRTCLRQEAQRVAR
eukprot:6376872-Prymnesium_polylepis.1